MAFDMHNASRETLPKAAYYTEAEQAALPASFISVPNVYNFRHTGAHSLPNKRRVRTDLMFRCAEPSPITPAGMSKVTDELQVTTVFDLRSATEIARAAGLNPVVHIPGTTRHHIPLRFKEDQSVLEHAAGAETGSQSQPRKETTAPAPDATSDATAAITAAAGAAAVATTTTTPTTMTPRYSDDDPAHFVAMYAEYLTLGADAYRTIFTHIRDQPGDPFIVHCMAGKDRTGVIVALVLELAGVSPEEIADEYALTTQGIAPWIPLATVVLLREPRFKGYPDRVARLLSSERKNMLAFILHLRDQWGGAEGYLRKYLGFSQEDIQRIRENATEPDA